ncbi:MAG: hybrid sensor histidine kinase/response regulator [Sphingomonadales bacterium]|nr:hybrid sensor histidine kinase/response regulator [Sphingomonadales bacterium]
MIVALSKVMMAPCASASSCTPLIGFGIWSFQLSNILLAISYLAIFLLLVIVGRRRKDFAFANRYSFVLLFVMVGTIAPVLRLYNFGEEDLLLAAIVRLVPAVITFTTAVMLWRLLPKMLSLPSSEQLRQTNEALRHEMAERRSAEAALLQSRKMEVVGRIAGGLAHEYNNMLQVISGNVRLIADRSDDAEIAGLADAAQAAVERGVLLSGKLLSFSQEQSFLLEPVHIPEFVAALPERVNGILSPRVTLEIEGGDIDASVLADTTQLELAILNVANNSDDAMPDGGQLRIVFSQCHARGRSDLSDGDYLQITIADTGLGMAPAVVDRAFDPFFSAKPAGTATGLGLSMVYAMARRSGGTATIESRLGEGTTVTLYLKQVAVEADSFDAASMIADESFAGRTIMLVDDEAATRTVVALTLESLDCTVVTAGDGAEALLLAEETRPDLFLLDYAMPSMNGAELAARLRARDPSSCFMFLTGFADFSAIRAVVGPDVIILQKPVSRNRLAHALTRAFAARQ